MIEGLKVIVSGAELREIAQRAAESHADRALVYGQQIASMEEAQVEGAAFTGGDPIRALSERRADHAQQRDELTFIAKHIDLAEFYLLDRDALYRLGIVKKQY